MESLLKETPVPPQDGDIIEGVLVAKEKTSVYIDLGNFGTGIIYGKEYLVARDIIKHTNMGDSITAKVVDRENENGYVELSLKEARQALVWAEAESAIKEKRPLDLIVKDANKGGLLMEWQGILGFLPASQLKPEHYPRIDDGDKDKILSHLKEFIGKPFQVSVITADPKEGKLIFSEKDTTTAERKAIVDNYAVGDEFEGEVTGSVDFGVFVKIQENLEGLVHISEMDWSLVEDPKAIYKPGDKVKVKIIEIKDGKISLSIKALKENPWMSAEGKYKKDQEVSGVVIKYNKHGALVSIEEGVAGLVHISEFENETDLRTKLELGKTYPFTITLFEPKDQRLTLSFKKEEK